MTEELQQAVEASPLGQTVNYRDQYAPELLVSIPRTANRSALGLSGPLPFQGFDRWVGYELSWLNLQGKPQAALLTFDVSCDSTALVESKSLKLYLNSFNQTQFDDQGAVMTCLQRDLSEAAHGEVRVTLQSLMACEGRAWRSFTGQCLDDLEVSCDTYSVRPDYLTTTEGESVQETLYTHLFKSNCLVTGQPDWASVAVHYKGQPIDYNGLFKYWVSYRQHNEFHEMCVERMFTDILRRCQPEVLCVEACFTRRGGLDISPWRATPGFQPELTHHALRQ